MKILKPYFQNNMSKYYNIKGLKVRVSDHEPNYSMDRFRGRNDIELYTKSADNRKLDVESQIEWLFIKGIIPDDLTIEDFEEIIDDYRD